MRLRLERNFSNHRATLPDDGRSYSRNVASLGRTPLQKKSNFQMIITQTLEKLRYAQKYTLKL